MPSSVDIRAIVCDKWDPFISLSPELPICHLIHPDGCITAVVLRINLITYLDSSPIEALVLAWLSDRCLGLYIVAFYISRMPPCVQCMSKWLLLSLFWLQLWFAMSFTQTYAHDDMISCSRFSAVHCLISFPPSTFSSYSLPSILFHSFFSTVFPIFDSILLLLCRWLCSAEVKDSLPGIRCVRDSRHCVWLREPSSVQPLFDQSQSVSLWR